MWINKNLVHQFGDQTKVIPRDDGSENRETVILQRKEEVPGTVYNATVTDQSCRR
jgi:hypothetical protein